MKWWFDPSYRIFEEVRGSGKRWFYPQIRKYFIWQYMDINGEPVKSTNSRIQSYTNFDEASAVIFKILTARKNTKIVKTQVHSFNEVYARLKDK